jgi:hypothetical protein
MSLPNSCVSPTCFRPGSYSVSRTAVGSYRHSRTSATPGSHPLPSVILSRVVNDDGSETFSDCHRSDFLWATACQTAGVQREREGSDDPRDPILHRLIDEGVADVEGNMLPSEVMRHSSSMVSRLLERVERLEAEVRTTVATGSEANASSFTVRLPQE